MDPNPPTARPFPRVPENPPARTVELRHKQLESGYKPDYGRGAGGGYSPLPDGANWMPHIGRRQRMRSFDRAWALFEKKCAKDDHYMATRNRLLDWIVETDTPEPELAAKAIVLTCLVKSEEHKEELRKHPLTRAVVEGTDWVDELNNALNQWEASRKEEPIDSIDPHAGIPPELPTELPSNDSV
jgi:hypothetical protein